MHSVASFSSQERCDNVVIVQGAAQKAMVRGREEEWGAGKWDWSLQLW